MSANCQTVQLKETKKNFQMDFRGNLTTIQIKIITIPTITKKNKKNKEVSLPQEMSVTTTRCLPW